MYKVGYRGSQTWDGSVLLKEHRSHPEMIWQQHATYPWNREQSEMFHHFMVARFQDGPASSRHSFFCGDYIIHCFMSVFMANTHDLTFQDYAMKGWCYYFVCLAAYPRPLSFSDYLSQKKACCEVYRSSYGIEAEARNWPIQSHMNWTYNF